MSLSRNGVVFTLLGLLALVAALLVGPFTGAEAAQSTARSTPQTLIWVLEVDGRGTSTFADVSGIGTEHEIIEHRVVDESGQEIVRKLPGRLRYENITLKRGITSNMDMWEWRVQVMTDLAAARRNGSLSLVTSAGETVAKWNFENGWPSKVVVPGRNADGTAVVEEFQLVVEAIQRVAP